MSNFIKPCAGRITSDFGWRIHPIKKVKSWHQGIDIAQAGAVAIVASADGIVTRVGTLGTYGNVVMIKHDIKGQTYETNYAHLKNGAKVKVGEKVKQGQTIAYMGTTGSSTAQHLHFEIHRGRWATGQPNAIDPERLTAFPEVKSLQEKLNKIGYKLSVDGISGNATESAIKDFQKKQKLEVDGSAGALTLKALDMVIKILENKKPPRIPPATKPVSNVKPKPKPELVDEVEFINKMIADMQAYLKQIEK